MTDKKTQEIPRLDYRREEFLEWLRSERADDWEETQLHKEGTEDYAHWNARVHCFDEVEKRFNDCLPEKETMQMVTLEAERDRLREALKYRTSACLAFDRMLQWDWFQQALLDAPRDIIEQIEFAREQSNIADQALARIAEIVGK